MATLFTKPKKKIVFLASGRGSNLKAVLQNIKTGKIRGIAETLICDNPDAKALEIAQEFELTSQVLNFSSFSDKSEYHTKLLELLLEIKPDLIVTAGYMRILKKPNRSNVFQSNHQHSSIFIARLSRVKRTKTSFRIRS